MRPHLGDRSRLRIAVGLGLVSGGLEVALRARPEHGLGLGELTEWWLIGVGTSVVLALCAAAVGRSRRMLLGWVSAVLLGIHGALAYRYLVVVNASLRDVLVWGGVLGIFGLAAVAGWLIERILGRRTEGAVRWALVLGLLTLPATLIRGGMPDSGGGSIGPNVVLITLDTVRPDHLSLYGSKNPTPSIDAIGARGARFQTVVSTAPLTQPSHLGILTGQPASRTGVVSNGTQIGDRPALLQRVLTAHGYQTAGFVSAFPLHGRFGWGQGMGTYDDDFGTVPGLHRLNLVRAWDLVAQRSHTLRERRASQTVGRAIRWLERIEEGPIFMWVHLFDPHGPYEAPGQPFDPPTDGEALDLPAYWPAEHRAITSSRWLEQAYDAEIRYVDSQLGRLLAVLQHVGRLDNTLVVLTADHGESLTEHGMLFDHGDDLMAPSLRVPMLISWPGHVEPGTIDCLASNMDVTPTVLGLLGIDDGVLRQGSDRSAELRGGPCTDEPVLSTTVSGRFVDPPPVDHALRWPGVKRIVHASGEVVCWRAPSGISDEVVIARCPDGMDTAMERSIEGGVVPSFPETDPATTEALRALGYIE
jgi:arylsulfatase A-like enzyme